MAESKMRPSPKNRGRFQDTMRAIEAAEQAVEDQEEPSSAKEKAKVPHTDHGIQGDYHPLRDDEVQKENMTLRRSKDPEELRRAMNQWEDRQGDDTFGESHKEQIRLRDERGTPRMRAPQSGDGLRHLRDSGELARRKSRAEMRESAAENAVATAYKHRPDYVGNLDEPLDMSRTSSWVGNGGYEFTYNPGAEGQPGSIDVTGGRRLGDRVVTVRENDKAWDAIMGERGAPAQEAAPAEDADIDLSRSGPAQEAAPAEDAGAAPVEEPAPAQESAPVEEPAPAQESDDATSYYKEGLAAARDENYEESIKHFLESQELKPHPSTLFNISKSYENMGDAENARKYMELSQELKAAEADIDLSRSGPAQEAEAEPVYSDKYRNEWVKNADGSEDYYDRDGLLITDKVQEASLPEGEPVYSDKYRNEWVKNADGSEDYYDSDGLRRMSSPAKEMDSTTRAMGMREGLATKLDQPEHPPLPPLTLGEMLADNAQKKLERQKEVSADVRRGAGALHTAAEKGMAVHKKANQALKGGLDALAVDPLLEKIKSGDIPAHEATALLQYILERVKGTGE